MQVEKQDRHRKISFRVSEAEFKKLQRQFEDSTCQRWSTYIRAVLLGKPVTVYTRNRSLDELVETLRDLQKDFRLHTHNKGIGKGAVPKAVDNMDAVGMSIKRIEAVMEKIGKLWLHESHGK